MKTDTSSTRKFRLTTQKMKQKLKKLKTKTKIKYIKIQKYNNDNIVSLKIESISTTNEKALLNNVNRNAGKYFNKKRIK